jgi:hypothetical protein
VVTPAAVVVATVAVVVKVPVLDLRLELLINSLPEPEPEPSSGLSVVGAVLLNDVAVAPVVEGVESVAVVVSSAVLLNMRVDVDSVEGPRVLAVELELETLSVDDVAPLEVDGSMVVMVKLPPLPEPEPSSSEVLAARVMAAVDERAADVIVGGGVEGNAVLEKPSLPLPLPLPLLPSTVDEALVLVANTAKARKND